VTATGRELLASALRGAPDSVDDGRRRAELELAQIELEDGDDTSAARRALRVLQGGAGGALALQAARVLQQAGEVAARREDAEVARRRFEFALPVVRREGTGDAALVGLLRLLGTACRRAGDFSAASGYWAEAVTLCSAAEAPDEGLLDTRGALLHDLGDMSLADQADPAGAVGYLEESLTACDAAGALGRVVLAASALHQASLRCGDVDAAARWRSVQARASFALGVARQASRLFDEPGAAADEPPTMCSVTPVALPRCCASPVAASPTACSGGVASPPSCAAPRRAGGWRCCAGCAATGGMARRPSRCCSSW